jgi:hypothetical protein
MRCACHVHFGRCDNADPSLNATMASRKELFAAKECASCCVPDGRATRKDCPRCKLVAYCGKSCQTEHWKSGHKKFCVPVAERKAQAAAAATERWNASNEHCNICQESLFGSTAAPLPCSHCFHVKCVENLAAFGGGGQCCPACRTPLPSLAAFLGQVVVGVNLIK